jgi:Flp pilus assembly pilin Flp
MKRLLWRLWSDDSGALIAAEWVFVGTILVLGVISGLVAVRQAVNSELTEFAQSVTALNQSYSFSGLQNCAASTAGSQAINTPSQANALAVSKAPVAAPATITVNFAD